MERTINDNQVIRGGIIFNKTQGYHKVSEKNPQEILLIDEKGNYYVVGQDGGYTDICIAKYDSNGMEIKKQTYGGSDFDQAYVAKYNSTMGIVISGISQSSDGDFSKNSDSPFVACIDPETLAFKWSSPVQIADSVYHVSDKGVYVVRNEGEKYNGKDQLKLSVVKLDANGKKLWATEPLSQTICGIAELSDSRVVILQEFWAEQRGEINYYSSDGKKLLTFKADSYGDIEPTNDGGFIVVSLRNIKTVPQPPHISSIWFDTETVVTKYDSSYKMKWRKTYDSIKDDKGIDKVIPFRDSSVTLEVQP